MPTLPWTAAATPPPADLSEVVVLASRLELRQLRTVPAFLRAAMAVRRQMLSAPGALGVSLIAMPFSRTFWTLSAWTSSEALDAAVRDATHVEVMRSFSPRLRASQFVTWTVAPSALPISWSDALARLERASWDAAA